jgi:hypothetical protein
MKWAEPEIERLGELIDAGLSSRKIARRMHRKDGAIQGKAWRLGWSFGQPRTADQRTATRTADGRRYARKSPSIKVCITFDDETYAEILSHTKGRTINRVQVIRELVEWGLEAVRHEAAA